MRSAAKTAVIAVPLIVFFALLRSCAGDEASRWRSRVAEIDPEARVVVDDQELIVIAPEEESGLAAAEEVQRFRSALVRDYGDLIGRGRDKRMVVVLFSEPRYVQAYAGKGTPLDPELTGRFHGYTDPSQGAIFLPPASTPTTLRHETVHWIVATTHGGLARFSPWLNEGLAQLFESYDADGGAPGVGPDDRDRARMLLRSDTIDVDRLLGLDDYREFVVTAGERNYLESLVLTAFLFERRDRELLKRYIEAERETETGRMLAFRRIYRHHEPEFQDDLRDYVREIRAG